MGCDIHLHTEVKIDGTWYTYGSPHMERSYALFAKMAGVRNEDRREEPISLPKGLPEDCGVVTLFDANREKGHSHSWFDSKEIAELEEWWEERYPDFPKNSPENDWDYFFGNSWGGFSKYPEDNPEGIEDVRFVFWFDC